VLVLPRYRGAIALVLPRYRGAIVLVLPRYRGAIVLVLPRYRGAIGSAFSHVLEHGLAVQSSKVECHVYCSPPLVKVQSQINPVHALPHCLSGNTTNITIIRTRKLSV
jgi:hypothetical protein